MERKTKYLLLFEAFNAKTISKTLGYLEDKMGKDSKNNFLNEIKNIMHFIDFPIDKINDKHLEYTSAKDALMIKSNGVVDNKFGLYCIKYWFSIEEGFITKTGVGNLEYDYEMESKANRYWIKAESTRNRFSIAEMRLLRTKLNINYGTLVPIHNYNELKDDDVVVCYLSNERNEEKLKIGKIKKIGDRLVIINNEFGEQQNDGTFNWQITREYSILADHVKLHHWNQDKSVSPAIIGTIIKRLNDNEEHSPYGFNLPIDYYYKLSKWRGYSSPEDLIGSADFCIILYFDNMLKDNYTEVSDTKQKRVEDKKGAIALLSNEEIKKANIKRYFTKILNNIDSDNLDAANLSRIPIKLLLGDYFLFAVSDSYYLSRYRHFVNNIQTILTYNNQLLDENRTQREKDLLKERIINEVNNLKTKAEDILKLSNSFKININKSVDTALKVLTGEKKKTLERIIDIGKKFNSIISKYEIETISDMKLIYYKIKSLSDLISNEQDFRLYNIPINFEYIMKYAEGSIANEFLEEDFNEYDKILDNIEKYVERF
jgi:hypothetical protein